MTLSVVLSVYAREKPVYLEQALESIWDNQTLRPGEIVLVEDGALTPGLYNLIDSWKNKLQNNLLIVKLSENKGLASALNAGIKHSSGDYIARMDTDDISLPARFEKQVAFLQNNPDVDILGTWAHDIDAEGNKLSLRKVPATHQKIMKYIWTCPLIHPSVMFKKQALLDVGLYNESIARRQDYELWFRCAAAGLQFANIPEPLLLYRFTEAWFEKNNASVLWQQAKMGWRGCRMLKLGPVAYIGTAFPLLKILLPKKAGMKVAALFKRVDPRNR